MSKKVKILISVVAVIALLTFGGAATVLADDGSTPAQETASKGLFARVANILGVTEDELVSAFKQARLEMQEEAFNKAIDKAVEKGVLTQEEASDIKAWWEQRPEALTTRLFKGILGHLRLGRYMRANH